MSETGPRGRGRPAANDPSTIPTDKLLDRALELFAERGFDGMSVRELAREFGVSHNLIPQRLGSKEQLWFQAVDRGFSALALELAMVIQAMAAEADDLAKLRALLVGFVEANTARPALMRIINQEATAAGPRLDHLFDNYIAPVRQFGDELLDRLMADGQLRSNSTSIVYFLMTQGAAGVAILPALAQKFGSELDPNDRDAIRAHAEMVVAIIFEGLVTRS